MCESGAELKLSVIAGIYRDGTFARGNVREGRWGIERSRGNVREGTFAKGDGGQNVRERMFAKGDLQGHRRKDLLAWRIAVVTRFPLFLVFFKFID